MKNKEMTQYIVEQLGNLIAIDSPSGYCDQIIAYIDGEVRKMGYKLSTTEKGGAYVTIEGGHMPTVGVAAHLDTLGAMVRSINGDGTIRFTSIGGFMMSTVNGAYCRIHTRDGRVITGTILSKQPSVHVYTKARDFDLIEENMAIRIDEPVKTKEDVEALGIEVGNFIGFDPKFEVTDSGYIKSRHLDNKAGSAILLGLLKGLADKKIHLPYTLKVIFSTYEEVGHGAAYIPEDIRTLLAIDMGAIGEDLSCTEEDVSICVKDSSGPYDHKMVAELLELSKAEEISYALDVYPSYGSDASAALRAGTNIKAALIGPGIHASHGMERTHETSIDATYSLLMAWLKK